VRDTKLSDPQLPEPSLSALSISHPSYRLVVQAANGRVALRTACSLYRHTTFTNSKRMPILAPVPMSRTGKVVGHCSHDHPRLELVSAFSEEATDLATLVHYAPGLAGLSGAQFSGTFKVGVRKSSDLFLAALHDFALENGQLSPENVTFCLLEDVTG
jgi:hypothetical protein